VKDSRTDGQKTDILSIPIPQLSAVTRGKKIKNMNV